MNFLVIGCGSIGRRHIKNLKEHLDQDVFAFDTDKNVLMGVEREFAIETVADLSRALAKKPDAVLICSPNHYHLEQAWAALEVCRNIFIEKPISHSKEGLDKFVDATRKKGANVLVGCNMRFHPCVKAIKSVLEERRLGYVVSARAQFGHWLPNWRSNVHYQDSYSAKEEHGGGIILDAIHEIDYLMWFFGEVVKVKAVAVRSGSLQIETEDSVDILLQFQNSVTGSIHADYIQRVKRRGCEIVGDKATLVWESKGKSPEKGMVRIITPDNLDGEIVSASLGVDGNAMYIEEMEHFIQCILQKEKPQLDAAQAAKVLDVAIRARTNATYV